MTSNDELWPNPTFYRWGGSEYVNGVWRETECPEAGTTAYMGSDWQSCERAEADVVEVPFTAWGDYAGSTVERSNHRVLLEEYPDTFIEIEGGYWSHSLYLPMAGAFKREDDLLEVIRKLYDYPLVNDEDHSMLEMDIAWESWEQWLSYDILMALREADLPVDDWEDSDTDFVRQRFYALTGEQDNGPVCEDAVSCYFPYQEYVTELLVTELKTLGLEHDPRRPNPNQLEMEV